MASMTTAPPPHAKRQRTKLRTATIKALQEERAEPIEIGTLVLPAGFESACGIMTKILLHLDIRSLCNVKRSSLIQQCRKAFGSDDFERVRDEALSLSYEGGRSIDEMILSHSARRLYLLIERYKREFPRGTPIVCACERGRMDDVELFVSLHPFHKYITNRDVNGYRDDMTLRDMVSQVGTNSYGLELTRLMIAVYNEHFQIVKYLIEQGGADVNITNHNGWNALHYAARRCKNIAVVKLLLENMSLDTINKKVPKGFTPLDFAYINRNIRVCVFSTILKAGGKQGFLLP